MHKQATPSRNLRTLRRQSLISGKKPATLFRARIHDLTDRLFSARRKLATAGIALLAALMAAHVVFGANGMVVYYGKRSEYRRLEKEVQQLQAENERITQQIKALKTDPATIEREAREQLRYARPGEVVYVLPAEEPPPAVPATAQKR
ncbi:MAG TPA: septum formation initiator family protein [Terriglobales bacterium]|nr:septum formation initiator family protein [Terriglobales bacterium]